MSEEWGPWIEHDGKHRPANGLLVEREYIDGVRLTGLMGTEWRAINGECPYYEGPKFADSWIFERSGFCVPVIRYRIRKPRALIQLIEMVENLPAPTERVTA